MLTLRFIAARSHSTQIKQAELSVNIISLVTLDILNNQR